MIYRNEYRYTNRFSPIHTWIVEGAKGAIHLNIYTDGNGPEVSGGLECHWRSPPAYMADQCPSHSPCWVLSAPCWHDGSSMAVTDFWGPFWLSAPHDHERMFRALEREYEERMNKKEEE